MTGLEVERPEDDGRSNSARHACVAGRAGRGWADVAGLPIVHGQGTVDDAGAPTCTVARRLKIFLSYATAQRALADDIVHRLEAAGHEVFFDRDDLPPGQSYDDRICEAIQGCELFVFLISPQSVAAGHYTRTELKIASRRWHAPGLHVLPVEVEKTPLAEVPSYLSALTILYPEGNVAAEVLLEMADRTRLRAAPLASAAAPSPPAPTVSDGPVPRYRSMRLRFAPGATGAVEIDSVLSDGGASAPSPWVLKTATTESVLWAEAAAVVGAERHAGPADVLPSLLPTASRVRQVGRLLFDALRHSASGPALEQALRGVDPQQGNGLRVVIDTTDAPDLARLPWEFCYSAARDDFVFSNPMRPLVRWLEVDEPLPTLRIAPPLVLLIAVATPTGRPGLEVGDELAHLDDSLAELAAAGGVRTVRLMHATLDRLDAALLRERPHVLHFIGHADFDGDEGVVLLESDAPAGTQPGPSAGAPDPISGRRLAVLLRNHLASLRLVFLNSCMGAAAARRDPFGGVAQSLIRRGVPAVIAMQFPIPDAAAVALARHFYRYLGAGQPVDTALTAARAFMVARGWEIEWGAPALYMRSNDGRLFDVGGDAAAPAHWLPTDHAEPPAFAQELPEARNVHEVPHVPEASEVPAVPAMFGASEPMPGVALPSPPPPPPPPMSAAPIRAESPLPARLPPAPSRRRGVRVLLLGGLVVAALAALGLWSMRTLAPEASTVSAKGAPPPAPPMVVVTPPAPTPVVPAPPSPAAPPPPDAGQPVPANDRDRAAVAEMVEQLRQHQLAEKVGASGERSDAERALLKKRLAEFMRRIDAPKQEKGAANATSGVPPKGDAPRLRTGSGDTLSGLAARLTGDRADWPAILRHHNAVAGAAGAAPIGDPDRIAAGAWLMLPPALVTDGALRVHVAAGDTLWRIALRFYGQGSRWPELAAANALTEPSLIVPGQLLRVPWPPR